MISLSKDDLNKRLLQFISIIFSISSKVVDLNYICPSEKTGLELAHIQFIA